MEKKKILIIGGGGREHALAWKLKQSVKVEKIFVAPGNGGTAGFCENVAIGVMEFEKIVEFAKQNAIDLVVVAPDDPLVGGLVDELKKQGIRAWGPVKAAAQIEGSKAFAKQLMQEQEIPTAKFQTFTDFKTAVAYVQEQSMPIVVKASGLALGKGVAICTNYDEVEKFLKKIFVDKIFGDAGREVVIEEFILGQEVSFHAFCDGKTYSLFPTAQDHKTIFEEDTGPNTGGMGTIVPVPWVTEELVSDVRSKVIEPALQGLVKKDSPFVGVLYPGIIVAQDGPKVLEFNARFGDPETQSYMRLLKTDLVDIMEASLDGKLVDLKIEWEQNFAVTIVLASGGYPGKYEKGKEITGIQDAEKLLDIIIFHAGTVFNQGKFLTNGGRVLNVTATGKSLQEALDKAYTAVKLISFEGMQYRKDIGAKSL